MGKTVLYYTLYRYFTVHVHLYMCKHHKGFTHLYHHPLQTAGFHSQQCVQTQKVKALGRGRCKTWTLDSGLDCWTGLLDWTVGIHTCELNSFAHAHLRYVYTCDGVVSRVSGEQRRRVVRRRSTKHVVYTYLNPTKVRWPSDDDGVFSRVSGEQRRRGIVRRRSTKQVFYTYLDPTKVR